MEASAVVEPRSTMTARTDSAPTLPWRDAFVFVLLTAWITVGVFLDGFAHAELTTPESFFTPWHALLYSGVLAANAWLISRIHRNNASGYRGLNAIPQHYSLSVLGVALFPLAGLGDLAWHTAFGIEVGIAQLLSPAHLLLLSAGLLMFSGPVRSALNARELSRRPGFRDVLPALLAATLITAITAFFLQFLSPFNEAIATSPAPDGDVFSGPQFDATVVGIASVLVTTILLVCAVMQLLRRVQLPFGSVTFLVTTVALLLAASEAFQTGPFAVPAALCGGMVTDVVIKRVRPCAGRPLAYHAVAAALPIAIWVPYFIGMEIDGRLAWHPELWGGTVFLSVLSGLALSLLATSEEGGHARRSAGA